MSINLTVYTATGKTTKTLTMPESVFGVKPVPSVVAQAVRVYLGNQRQGTAVAKDRGDVAYSKAKIYRQKGTGNARHGARTAPIFVGGGSAHGPSGTQNYRRTLSRRLRRMAFRSILSDKCSQKAITIVDDFGSLKVQTKTFAKLLTGAKLNPNSSTLVILDSPQPNVIKAARNLAKVSITQAKRLNVYELLKASQIVITPAAVATLDSLWGKAKTPSKTTKSTPTKLKTK